MIYYIFNTYKYAISFKKLPQIIIKIEKFRLLKKNKINF